MRQPTALVEYYHDRAWVFYREVTASTPEQAKELGLEEARSLWRNRCAGVRVTVISPEIVLERLRD